jgi:hypothetical protein
MSLGIHASVIALLILISSHPPMRPARGMQSISRTPASHG